MLTPRQIAEQGTFLVKEVGSSVHGTNIEGVDDLDLMGVAFQPPEYTLGLQRFEQYVYRTAREREGYDPGEDQRKAGREPPSRPGDTDLVIYSVQKYLRLALSGNPSVLVLLFSPKRHREYEINLDATSLFWADTLEWLAEDIASQQAGVKFLGYLRAQKERMLGTRGQMRVTRQELIDTYGFDLKYAMQAIRLGLQGIEFMQTGKLSLPMHESLASELREIRQGGWVFSQVIEWIDSLENDLKRAIDNSQLLKHPNYTNIDKWLVRTQQEYFAWLRNLKSQALELTAKLP